VRATSRPICSGCLSEPDRHASLWPSPRYEPQTKPKLSLRYRRLRVPNIHPATARVEGRNRRRSAGGATGDAAKNPQASHVWSRKRRTPSRQDVAAPSAYRSQTLRQTHRKAQRREPLYRRRHHHGLSPAQTAKSSLKNWGWVIARFFCSNHGLRGTIGHSHCEL